jgi:hypothetical protein
MTLIELKSLTLDELRDSYRSYLINTDLSKNTIQTCASDTFYIWRKSNASKFWEIIESPNFEDEAFSALNNLLPKQANGKPNKNIQGYMAHLRRFHRFVSGNALPTISQPISSPRRKHRRSAKVMLPKHRENEVDKYLASWNTLENYSLQEAALDKLFFTLVPHNTCIEDILLKVSTLNDFYSTNIFSVFPVAKHILSLDIDIRLVQGDPTLVDAIKTVDGRNHYSFATKYCSHHNPLEFPIYDSYVEKVLKHFRDVDGFYSFETEDLKQYDKFKQIILAFRAYYGLSKYTLKEIDQYIWQLGKEFFPKTYYSKK